MLHYQILASLSMDTFKSYQNNEMLLQNCNDEFELPSGSFFSEIQDYFEYIIKKPEFLIILQSKRILIKLMKLIE